MFHFLSFLSFFFLWLIQFSRVVFSWKDVHFKCTSTLCCPVWGFFLARKNKEQKTRKKNFLLALFCPRVETWICSRVLFKWNILLSLPFSCHPPRKRERKKGKKHFHWSCIAFKSFHFLSFFISCSFPFFFFLAWFAFQNRHLKQCLKLYKKRNFSHSLPRCSFEADHSLISSSLSSLLPFFHSFFSISFLSSLEYFFVQFHVLVLFRVFSFLVLFANWPVSQSGRVQTILSVALAFFKKKGAKENFLVCSRIELERKEKVF